MNQVGVGYVAEEILSTDEDSFRTCEVESGLQTATLFPFTVAILTVKSLTVFAIVIGVSGGLCAPVCLRNVRRVNSGISRSRSVIPQHQTHRLWS